MILFQLFYEFFVIGAFLFGGGLAVIPFLQQMSEKTGWFTVTELMDIVAVSEAAPGPVGVNMTVYVGYTVAGVPGGVAAAFGLLLPSVIIALAIARLLASFRNNRFVESALYGLRPAALGLIASAGLAVFSVVVFSAGLRDLIASHFLQVDYKALILAAVLFFATNTFKKVHPVLFLSISAAVGIFVF